MSWQSMNGFSQHSPTTRLVFWVDRRERRIPCWRPCSCHACSHRCASPDRWCCPLPHREWNFFLPQRPGSTVGNRSRKMNPRMDTWPDNSINMLPVLFTICQRAAPTTTFRVEMFNIFNPNCRPTCRACHPVWSRPGATKSFWGVSTSWSPHSKRRTSRPPTKNTPGCSIVILPFSNGSPNPMRHSKTFLLGCDKAGHGNNCRPVRSSPVQHQTTTDESTEGVKRHKSLL